jgi:hypothetical protein
MITFIKPFCIGDKGGRLVDLRQITLDYSLMMPLVCTCGNWYSVSDLCESGQPFHRNQYLDLGGIGIRDISHKDSLDLMVMVFL